MSALPDWEPHDDLHDWVVVERFLSEQPTGRKLTDAERDDVVGRLVAIGAGPSEIARRLNVSNTTAVTLINRHRKGLR